MAAGVLKERSMKSAWITGLAAMVFLSVAAGARAADNAAPADNGKFRDVTVDSGVDAFVKQYYGWYENQPKPLWLSAMDLIDVDGDGWLDLYLGGHGFRAAVARNDGKMHFIPVDPQGLKTDGMDMPYPGSEVHLAHDLDEDGKVDIAVTFGDGGVRWWRNHTAGDPPVFDFKPAGPGFGGCRINALIDLDRDGKVDWLTTGGEGRNAPAALRFFAGKGDGTFAPAKLISPADVGIPVDLRGNGRIDLIMRSGSYDVHNGYSRIYLNDGQMNFHDGTAECGMPTVTIPLHKDAQPETVGDFAIKGVGDFNQDGAVDLIVVEQARTVEIYLNDGKGHFTKKVGAISGMEGAPRPAYGDWGIAVVTDFDNDGIPDIIMDGRNFLHVLRGTGGGNFEYMNTKWGLPKIATAAVDEGICFGDVDKDGRLDIVACNGGVDKNKTVGLFHNELPTQHWLNVRPIGLKGNRGAAGSKIRLYEAGGLGDPKKLIWYEQVAIWGRQSAHSYYTYAQTERHFGLGQRDKVDVEVEFYPTGTKVPRKGVSADATMEIPDVSN
jgi:hypothetical protein